VVLNPFFVRVVLFGALLLVFPFMGL